MEQRVLISHAAPKEFHGTQNWSKVCSSISSRLPLRNVTLRSPRNATTPVADLDVSLVPLESVREESVSQMKGSVLEKPLLHLYILYCQDDDIEGYRTNIKKEAKDWHSSIISRKHSEWLILQIVRPPDPSRPASRGVFRLQGTVQSKLKADFNTDERDRVVQVTYESDNSNDLIWAEFFQKVKEGVSIAFSNAIAARTEEVKRSESQQSMPGWNFCTFFVLKESLATSYEGVGLVEDALQQYYELETLFQYVSRERNFSWFGALINPVPGDDSAPLLSISKKPYRDLILANKISVFDFRIYILSRQCELLAKIGSLSEVPRKVASFLGAFSKRLFEVESHFPKFFVESWIYSSAITTVEQCTVWQRHYDPDGLEKLTVDAGNAELLDLARSQLEVIGIELGYLPRQPPFTIALPKRTRRASVVPADIPITSEDIRATMEGQDAFYDIYIRLTTQALGLYAEGGRRKFALKLHGALAALDLHRGHLDKALTTFASLHGHYAPHSWTSLESYMLSRALDTHSLAQKGKDGEWIHILLDFLKSYVEHRGADMLIPIEDPVAYVSKFVVALKDVASATESDIRHPDHPAFSLHIENKAKLAGDRDGAYLDVVVRNHLPCDFRVDEVTVFLQGRDVEKHRFSTPIDTLKPGRTRLTLFCPVPASGLFVIDSSEIRAAKLLLQYPQKKIPGKPVTHHDVVRIPTDPLALDIRIFTSRRVELDRRCLSLRISTGRNSVEKMELKLTAPSVTFRYRDAVLDDDAENVSYETGDSLKLLTLASDTAVVFTIPYVEGVAVQTMRIEVEVIYTTTQEPELERILHLVSSLSPSLPVSVNVQDWFREARLISTFSVSSTTHQHIRVAETQLIAPQTEESVTVIPCAIRQGTITVTPSQPARFMYALDALSGPVKDSLTFIVKYRLLREEVAGIIEQQVRDVLKDAGKSQDLRPTAVTKLIEALERDPSWVAMYNITGEIKVPPIKAISESESEMAEVLESAGKRLEAHRHPEEPAGSWRELRLPVDVPVKSIVAITSIRLLGTPFNHNLNSESKVPLYAGQPISAELRIHTSFRWGLESDANRQYVLNYQIEDMTREWLIGGLKQGDFIARNDNAFIVPVTLMALHHGEFPLPKIKVEAQMSMRDLTMGGQAPPSVETYQSHSAVKVLVLPRGGRSTYVVAMGSASDA